MVWANVLVSTLSVRLRCGPRSKTSTVSQDVWVSGWKMGCKGTDVEFEPENRRDILNWGNDAFQVVCFKFGGVKFKLAGDCVLPHGS